MIIIKTLHFEDYEDFACVVSNTYDRIKSDDKYNSIDVVAKYEDAKEIIRELIGIGYGIAFIDKFGNPEWDGYDDAFVISLLDDEIWCEPVKRDNGYIFIEADVVYIFDDCNSKIIPKIEADEVYEVGIGNEYDDCDGDCENCPAHDETYLHTSEDEDGNTHGFTASRSDGDSYMSYSYYSSNELSHEDIQKMLKAFGF
nr:MAG TPA: hypothetical protein [Bacteriophage sp.]DAX09912.1 MAG TPA: hypothetical protein [Bacteriophage sp.]